MCEMKVAESEIAEMVQRIMDVAIRRHTWIVQILQFCNNYVHYSVYK